MPYPPLPVDKQYSRWFPPIPTRGVPSPPGDLTVERSALALQPDTKDSAETLSAPKKIEFGVLRVWVAGAGRESTSYDDGPNFDRQGHGAGSGGAAEDEALCLAPGTDEAGLQIHWQVFGVEHIRSAKLELYCREHPEPIWAHHWGDGWGRRDEDIASFASKADPTSKFSKLGSYAFAGIEPDAKLELADALGERSVAFADGVLTLARSPYQLRLTVSGCTAPSVPADGDRYAYPGVAWTYVHVAIHSFCFRFGPNEWLSAARDDLDAGFRAQIVGTREDQDHGLEGRVLGQLRERAAKLSAGMTATTRHELGLVCNHNTRRNRVLDQGKERIADVENLEKMWGAGVRVPIVAKPRLVTVSGEPTDEGVAAAVRGARLMWDWREPELDRWKQATDTSGNHGQGRLTRDVLAKIIEPSSSANLPRGSCNCPGDRGGKLGAEARAPVFSAQASKGDGKGSLPFTAAPLSQRSWAVSSTFDDEGETGVQFWPSRLAGDSYQVETYLHTDASLDTTEALTEHDTACGSPGMFEVYRALKVHHVVVGSLGSLDAKQIVVDAVAHARRQCSLLLEVETEVIGGDYSELAHEAIRRMIARPSCAYRFAALELPRLLELGAAPSTGLVGVKPHSSFVRTMESLFRGGKLRLVEVDEANELDLREAVTIGDVSHMPVDLGERVDGKRVCYMVTPAGEQAIVDGAQALGEVSERSRTMKLAVPARSCWRLSFKHRQTLEHGKALHVRFAGGEPVELEFKRAWTLVYITIRLTDGMKSALREGLREAVERFDDGETFEVVIEGDGSTHHGEQRVEKVLSFVDDQVNEHRVLIQRSKVFELYTQRSPFWRDRLKSSESSAYAVQVGSLEQGAVHEQFSAGFAEAYAAKRGLEQGVVVIHSGRATNFTSTKAREQARWNPREDAWVDICDESGGGYCDEAFAELEDLSLVRLVTPDPAWDSVGPGQLAPAWAAFLHELGHALSLDHASLAPDRSDQAAPSTPPRRDEHTRDESCIMSYDPAATQFCATCMLRLRGWRWDDLAGADPHKWTLSFGPADMDLAFADTVADERGLQARLQVLGLFNRPLKLIEDPHFKTECEDAWKYVWALADRLVPGLHADPDKVLAKALRNYMFEDGRLPDPSEARRLRVWGHLHPFYANMDLAMRYGDATIKNAKENAFKMLAVLGDLNATYQSQNPGIGAFPVELQLTDAQGRSVAGQRVFISLIVPTKPEQRYDPDFAGRPLVGGTSYVKNAAPARMHAHCEAYFDKHVRSHKPSAGGDPQAGNVHVDMGGKRGFFDDGDVCSAREDDGLRNVFSPSVPRHAGVEPVAAIHPGTGERIPHTVQVTTDEHGVATFLFTPSTVAGDRYRLRAQVLDPQDPDHVLAEVETGDMVIWRTYRVAGYRIVPQAKSAADLTASQKYYWERITVNPGDPFEPLVPCDLRKSVADELAKAYGEVIFDAGALEPEPLDDDYWRRFRTSAAELYARYPLLETRHMTVYMRKGFPQLLRPSASDPKRFEGTLPVPVRRGFTGLHWYARPNMTLAAHAFAHDYDASADGSETERAFVALAKGELVSGHKDWDYSGDPVALGPGCKIDYGSREVTVVLADDPSTYCRPKKLEDGDDRLFRSIESFVFEGATLDNTDGGVVHAKISAGKRDKLYDVEFFSSWAMGPKSVVARAKGVSAGQAETAKPENGSGLTIGFELVAKAHAPSTVAIDTGVHRVWAWFFPERVIDPDNLLESVKGSPWLVNYRSPEEYNLRRRPEFQPAHEVPLQYDPTLWERIAGGKDDLGWAETILMRSLSAALGGGQGSCFYPGQFYIHANYLNPMQGGLSGKGVGNTALIFASGQNNPQMSHYLVLHETGHCLYGVHAHPLSGRKQSFHDCDDSTYACIMANPSFSDGRQSLGSFCGKCLAGLRGMLVMEEPLYSASMAGRDHDLHRDPDSGRILTGAKRSGAIPPGDAKAIFGAALGGYSRVLPLAPAEPDPHQAPAPEDESEFGYVWRGQPEVVSKDCAIDCFPQKKSQWCWAAVSQMMRKHYNDERIDQCALVTAALFGDGGVDCCAGEHDARCNKQHALVLIGLRYKSSGQNTPLDFATIRAEIDADRPFIFAKRDHYRICYGYAEGSNFQELHVWDPLPVGRGARVTMSYEDYENYVRAGGENVYEFSSAN